MKNSKKQKILGVTIDNKVTLKSHIRNSGKKASQKYVLYQGSQII